MLNLVAALMAAADEFREFVQTYFDRGRIVAGGNFGKYPLYIVLATVEVAEKLFDRSPLFQHRNEPFAQSLLLGAQSVDARLQIAAVVAVLLDLRHALRLGKPLRDRVDGGLGIGAGEMMHRRIGVDLGPRQFFHAPAHATEPQFERVVRLALAQQRVGQPKCRGDEYERDEDDEEPGELLRQRLGAERPE